MRVRVAHDVERFTTRMDDADKRHVPFALARALTWTAKDAQGDVQDELPKRFTLRNNWVKSGIKIDPATKVSPQAVVGSLARGREFMERQETGGSKTGAGGHRIAIPVKAKRNKRDIIPKGQRPGALRGKPKIFMVKTASGAGIVRRVGRKRYPLQLLYWLKRGVQVKPAFGFQVRTGATVGARFGPNFVESLSQAIGHRG